MNSFYKNKHVLITGHTGFKGSWLSLVLHSLGSKVHGVSDFKIKSGIYEVIKDQNIFQEEFNVDIVDKQSLFNYISNNKFDMVFHFAAQGLVSEAKKNPESTLLTNIIGTFNVLDVCNKNKNIKEIVISTTDKVYKNHNDLNSEEYELGGDEFYSASKTSSELVINSFIKTIKRKGLNIGVVRSGNVLGGGDYGKNRILTDIIMSLKQNKNILLRNPNSIRPWQYILDSIEGYLQVGKYISQNNTQEIFNLNSSTNNKFTVEMIAQRIVSHWDHPENINIIKDEGSKFFESKILTIDSTKAKNILGWESKFEVDQICKFIVDYEKNNDKYLWVKNHINKFFNFT